jgi:hypothetical protein
MSDRFDEFFLFNPIFDRSAEMKPQLVGAIQGNQRGHCDEAAIPFRQLLPLPYIVEQYAVCEFNHFGEKSPINFWAESDLAIAVNAP